MLFSGGGFKVGGYRFCVFRNCVCEGEDVFPRGIGRKVFRVSGLEPCPDDAAVFRGRFQTTIYTLSKENQGEISTFFSFFRLKRAKKDATRPGVASAPR